MLVERARVAPESGIVDERPPIAFEVAVIDRIESHQRRKQPDVGFGQLFADEEAAATSRRCSSQSSVSKTSATAAS